jgi:hypothetical protein
VTQRIDGRLSFQLLSQVGEMVDFAAVHCFEQGFARGEMPLEGADADAGGARDSLKARFGAAGAENRFGCLEHQLTVPHGIGAGLARIFF